MAPMTPLTRLKSSPVLRKLASRPPIPVDPAPRRTFDEADINKRAILGFAELVMRRQGESTSQLGADLWALYELDELRDGYFVEFGAADGQFLSNTYLLEAHYGWTGILAEPNATVFPALQANRPNCITDPRAVYREGGTTQTLVVAEVLGVLSSLTEFAEDDDHADARRGGQEIQVETVTLNQLLDDHNAPNHINYLSLDTEGGELDILKGFDFARRTIDLITVEHNFDANREAMRTFLDSRGYDRVFLDFSRFDDWYVRRDLKRV